LFNVMMLMKLPILPGVEKPETFSLPHPKHEIKPTSTVRTKTPLNMLSPRTLNSLSVKRFRVEFKQGFRVYP